MCCKVNNKDIVLSDAKMFQGSKGALETISFVQSQLKSTKNSVENDLKWSCFNDSFLTSNKLETFSYLHC